MSSPDGTRLGAIGEPAVPVVRHSVAVTLVAIAIIVAIGWLDVVTGAAFGMSLLYLMPIVASGWWVGRRSATATAMAAAIAWYVAELLTQHHSAAISAWNAFTRLAIFMLVGMLLALARRDRMRLMNLLAIADSLARTDALTGLANSRAFEERLTVELPRLARSGAPLCVAYVDLDNFKRVNDRYGHADGDAVLRHVASVLRQCVRAGDVPARLGGDELAILLWDCSARDAVTVCERILAGVAEIAQAYPRSELGASAGIAWFQTAPEDAKVVLARADQAMYRAKHGGKQRVVVLTDDRSVPPEAVSVA